MTIITTLLKALCLIILLLIAIAYFTLAERKILAATQRRRGPNVVGAYGLLQPLVDGLKLFTKETIIPSSSEKLLFLIAPLVTFWVCLITWAVIPFAEYAVLTELDFSILYLLACSATGIYGILIAGWASNSKYAFLGSLRSAAQMISYEIPIGMFTLTIAFCSGSFNISQIVEAQRHIGWYGVWFFPIAALFFTCGVAETNRHPFDLPEAEAELVSGYNVEYAAMGFALFSLGEYSNILLMSALNTILFWGGWLPPFACLAFIPGSFWFSIKILFFVILYIVLRAELPRYRYDQLMEFGWKILLITSVAFFYVSYSALWLLNALPS